MNPAWQHLGTSWEPLALHHQQRGDVNLHAPQRTATPKVERLVGAVLVHRRAASAASKLQPKVAARNMSGGASIEEEIAEYQKWRSISFVAVPCLVGFGAYTLSSMTHHHSEKPGYEYMQMRTKRFPWPKGDVALFDKAH